MVDNVTVGSVCAQSPSFMPDLDGGKNKTQLIVDDIVAYLKNPSVYSLEKEGPLNHFVNYCSEVELGFYSDGAYSILVSRSKQQPEGIFNRKRCRRNQYSTYFRISSAYKIPG